MFDDIRPFNDAEVGPLLQQTVRDRELLAAVRGLVLKRWPRAVSPLLTPAVAAYLRWQVRAVKSVDDLQVVMEKYLQHTVDKTTSGFTVSGIDNVPADGACLFLGNHRDIALDPAFMSLALRRSGRPTCRVAIGDNLLSKEYAANLMRMNKCFVVKRSAAAPRALLQNYQQLSKFIRQSVSEEAVGVWIAQREGRAKDGDDRTEPAVLKMLHMSARKEMPDLADYLCSLPLVPVSISYEFNPCEALKAQELAEKNATGEYVKAQHEDMLSIAEGVRGYKGRVHLSFCPPLQHGAGYETAEQIAQGIDTLLHRHYMLHPSNLFAFEETGGEIPPDLHKEVFGPEPQANLVSNKQREFNQRLSAYDSELRSLILAMYARPVLNRIAADDV